MDRDILRNGKMFSSTSIDPSYFIYLIFGLAIFVVIVWFIYSQLRKLNYSINYCLLFTFMAVGNSIVLSVPFLYWEMYLLGCLLLYSILVTIFVILKANPSFLQSNKEIGDHQSSSKPAEDLSQEREKILQMLEDGKINFEEAKELLNAIHEPIEKNTQQTNHESQPIHPTPASQLTEE